MSDIPGLVKLGYTSAKILDEVAVWNDYVTATFNLIKKPDAYFCVAIYAVKEEVK